MGNSFGIFSETDSPTAPSADRIDWDEQRCVTFYVNGGVVAFIDVVSIRNSGIKYLCYSDFQDMQRFCCTVKQVGTLAKFVAWRLRQRPFTDCVEMDTPLHPTGRRTSLSQDHLLEMLSAVDCVTKMSRIHSPSKLPTLVE